MTNEERFKQKLNGLVNEREFTYNASNWERASLIMDKKDRKKQALIFFSFVSVVAGIVLVVSFWMAGSNEVVLSSRENQSTSFDKQHSETRVNSKEISKETNPDFLVKKTAAKNKTFQHKSAGDNSKVKETNTLRAWVNEKNSKVYKPVIENLDSKEKRDNSNKRKQISVLKTAVSETVKESKVSEKEIFSNNIVEDEGEVRSESSDHAKESLLDNTFANDSSHTKDLDEIQEPPSASSITLFDPGLVDSHPDVNGIENSTETFKSKKDSTNADSLGTKPENVEGNEEPEIMGKTARTFFLEGGTYYNAGWKYHGTQEGTGFNVYAGLGCISQLTERLGVRIGLYYAPVSHLQMGKKIVTGYSIMFGETREITEITPLALHYVQLPVNLQIKTWPRQTLSIGFGLNYLIDVYSRVDKYTEELNTEFNKSSFRAFGYKEGFNKLNGIATLGYRYEIFSGWWINGQFIFGLTELWDKQFFVNEVSQKQRGLIFSIQYSWMNR